MREPTTSLSLKSSNSIDCGPHRVSSVSVSWNASGQYVAMAGSDSITRIMGVDAGGTGAREVLVIGAHTAPVTKVRFHPTEESLLCTAANDKVISVWDVRNATQRCVGGVPVQHGNAPMSVEWSRHDFMLAVAEKDGTIYVYDSRKLPAAAASTSDRASAGGRGHEPLYTFQLPNKEMTEACIFSPDGKHLIAEICSDYVGSLQVWPLKGDDSFPNNITSFPTHGPIYSMQFSPNQKYLATGAADACASVWDADTMACIYTVARPTKYVSSVGFSHDSKLLATYSNIDSIDIADASNGALVGLVTVTGTGRRLGVLEEVSWHPKEHLLACARKETHIAGMPPCPVALVKIDVEQVASQ